MAVKAPIRRSRARRIGTAGGGVLSVVFRLTIALSLMIMLAGGILFFRLSQGPVAVPWLGEMLVARANATSETVSVDVDGVFLDLGDGSIPTGLEFRGVTVNSRDGEPLFHVPRLRSSFDLADLLQGQVRPTRISVLSADTQFIRTPDGRIRFGLGSSEGIALDGTFQADTASTTRAGADSIAKLIDGLVGDSELAPEVSKLRLVEIVGARIQFSDRRAHGQLLSRAATFRFRRDAGGASAIIEIAHETDAPDAEVARIIADRRRGSGTTHVAARFGRVDIRKLATIEPAFDALAGLDTALEGEFTGAFDRSGALTDFSARLLSDGGTLDIDDQTHVFDMADLRVRGAPGSGRLIVEKLDIALPHASLSTSGILQTGFQGDERWSRIDAQLDIGSVWLAEGVVFADAASFDRGQFVGTWKRDEDTVEIAESWLGTPHTALKFQGRVSEAEQGLVIDLSAGIDELTVADLVKYWPPGAAGNAREWVEKNITEADLSELSAEVRIAGNEVRLALDTGFSDLVATYVDGMNPIRRATGEMFMDYGGLFLRLDTATVVPPNGEEISLSGSTARIKEFHAGRTLGDFVIKAKGPTDGVLSLLDQRPLSLISSLGVEMREVGGGTEALAKLNFPLLANLTLDDVEVSADAVMTDVALSMPLGDGDPVTIRSDRLSLTADTRRMQLSGPVRVEGEPLNIEWREDYATRPGSRRLMLAGALTGEMLEKMGVGGGVLAGNAAMGLDLNQRGAETMRFELETDLREARVALEELDWTKPAGVPGVLKASGSIGRVSIIDKLALEAPGLRADGAVEIGPGGEVIRADFSTVRIPGRLDARISIQPGSDGVRNVRITGPYLNIAESIDRKEAQRDMGDPVRVQLSIDRLQLTDGISVRNASGNFSRAEDGTLEGTLDGALGPGAPVSIALKLPSSGSGDLTLRSANAGAALRHTDIYRGAEGGVLRVDAKLPPSGTIVGRARIDDVVVRSQSTFRDVLRNGGLPDAGQAVSTSGLGFRSVSIPFRYSEGVVEVTDAIASSPVLGLKLNGTLNENTDAIDLKGVLSPAYALTGALNEIPLLGEILSGGRGEGIVGMTFTLKGAMHNPRFSVNPLSLLAPGVLRKVFTGGSSDGSEEDFRPSDSPQQR